MAISLPVISKGMKIGEINLSDRSIALSSDSNLISFTCDSLVDCCSRMKIPVTEFDIQQIQDKGYELDQIIQNLSPIILPAKTPARKSEKVYLIKRKPFDATCTFLGSETKLCTIHDFKPFACETYPFSLDILEKDRISVIIHTESLCKAIQSTQQATSDNESILKGLLTKIMVELEMRQIPE